MPNPSIVFVRQYQRLQQSHLLGDQLNQIHLLQGEQNHRLHLRHDQKMPCLILLAHPEFAQSAAYRHHLIQRHPSENLAKSFQSLSVARDQVLNIHRYF